MKHRENFTAYEIMPENLAIYMSHYGPHFNKQACLFAVSNMYRDDKPLAPFSKKEVDDVLYAHNIKPKNNVLYDATYVANMCKADYYGSSIPNDEAMAKYIKDTLDDPDGEEGLIFNRWIADMKWLGVPIPWEDFV